MPEAGQRRRARMTVRLMVVDDHAIVRRGIVQVLAEHPDVQIVA